MIKETHRRKYRRHVRALLLGESKGDLCVPRQDVLSKDTATPIPQARLWIMGPGTRLFIAMDWAVSGSSARENMKQSP